MITLEVSHVDEFWQGLEECINDIADIPSGIGGICDINAPGWLNPAIAN
jgi:hypothetical protein